VRTSTDELIHELENVRWLFLSIFLLGGASFFVLARYLQQTVLQPLEDIRRVARNLADGEPEVEMPEFGDDEIAELGAFIRTLGDNRRHSRILRTPKVQELMRRVAAKAEADRAAGRVVDPGPDRTSDRSCDRSDSDANPGAPDADV
jgi:HAMP domain-containing protein